MNALIKATAKRYRYTGKERDEESGLYYHGARYYIPWLCRWSTSDPLENKYAGMSPYNYGNCNPIVFNDPSGMGGEDVVKYTRPDEKAIYLSKDAKPNFVKEGDELVFLEPGHKQTNRDASSLLKVGDLISFTDEYGVFYTSSFTKNKDGSYTFSGYVNKEGEDYLQPEASSVTHEGNSRNSEYIGNSITGLNDSYKRLEYKSTIEKMSAENLSKVLDAKEIGDYELAEKVAKNSSDTRNQIRTEFQKKQSPVGKSISEVLDRKRSWDELYDKYKGDDKFKTMEKITEASGRSNNQLASITKKLRVAAWVGLVWSTIQSAREIWNASPEKRGEVAAQEAGGLIGGVLGGMAGSILAIAALAFVGGLLAVTPGGWFVLGASLIGGTIIGEIGKKIAK